MYNQKDKKAAVKEVQRYLFFLSDKKHKSIPRIPIDGEFDEETRVAVKEFQRIKGLAQTGEVDYITYTELYREYDEAMLDHKTQDYFFLSSRLPLKEGELGDDIRIMNLMLGEFKKTYPCLTDAGEGSYFSLRSANAVEELREIFMLPDSRIFDKQLYRRSIAELNSIHLAEKKYD